MRLAGKRALITGAASGIGRASAELFASEGARVVAVDADERVREVAPLAVVADVADEAAMRGAFELCDRELGGVDVVFANAGVGGSLAPLLELEVAQWRRVLDVNLIGVFLCIKLGAPRIAAAGGGSIVCTASVAGLRTGAGPAHYGASKAGVINLVQSAAAQLAGTGVRVNALCPGLVETGMTRELFERARAAGKGDRIGQLNPTRRAGQPDELARAAMFLASDDSSYVNGQALAVDGGLSCSLPFVPGRLM